MAKVKQIRYVLGQSEVRPGSQRLVNLPVGSFTNNMQVDLGVVVTHGRDVGPTLLVTGCVHGDEINGAEIIRRLLRLRALDELKGTLLSVPLVNVPAFLNRSRYLPDRRDLNRLFPGSSTGSLGARLAKVISDELVPRSDVVIDLHTGAVNRANLPQLRVSEGDERGLELAEVFSPPVTIVAPMREGSFRGVCRQANKPMLLFESGEALRLDSSSIRFGVQGILSVMREIGMLPKKRRKTKKKTGSSVICRKSAWERAPCGGLFTPHVALGKTIEKGEILGFVADPFGLDETPILASRQGVLIGRTNEGLADEGDALFHIASTGDLEKARGQIAESAQAFPTQAAAYADVEDDHPVPYHPFQEEVEDQE